MASTHVRARWLALLQRSTTLSRPLTMGFSLVQFHSVMGNHLFQMRENRPGDTTRPIQNPARTDSECSFRCCRRTGTLLRIVFADQELSTTCVTMRIAWPIGLELRHKRKRKMAISGHAKANCVPSVQQPVAWPADIEQDGVKEPQP